MNLILFLALLIGVVLILCLGIVVISAASYHSVEYKDRKIRGIILTMFAISTFGCFFVLVINLFG